MPFGKKGKHKNMADGIVKIKVDLDNKELQNGLKQSKSVCESAFDGIKKAGVTAFKAIAATSAAIGAAMVKVTKSAVESFAEYEQLVGGSKLMFGDAYSYIADKAANAYDKVQMSANEYLAQVNGLATGLKSSLNGDAQAAAELADKVVTAEADVVAATGASQEAVQSAFNGIMKSNYTMLDNLQLGIKPTKEGMQEVIDKVNEWNKANGHATKYQIDNLADCQSALVDYIEMQGMAGYAANEGATTIKGSLAKVKGAWSNLLTGIADSEQDITALFDNFLNSAIGLGELLLPYIETAVDTIFDLLEGIIANDVPVLLEKVIQYVVDNLPALVNMAVGLLVTISEAIIENAPMLMDAAITIIQTLATQLTENLPTLVTTAITMLLDFVQYCLDNIDLIIDLALDIIMALADGIIQAVPILIEKAPQIITSFCNAIIRNFPKIVQTAGELVGKLAMGIIGSIAKLVETAPKLIKAFCDGFSGLWQQVKDVGKNFVQGLWERHYRYGTMVKRQSKRICNQCCK